MYFTIIYENSNTFFRGSLTTNGHLPREVTQSERDLTKVTKVRVRSTNAKEMMNNGPTITMTPSSSMMQMNSTPSLMTPQGAASFKPRAKMKTTTMIITKDDSISSSVTKLDANPNIDVVRDPLNWQLVDQTVNQLQKASDDLVQLYKRISLDYDMEDKERAKMLQKLAFSAGVSQQTLKPVNPAELRPVADAYPQVLMHSQPHQGPSWC